MSRDLIDLAMMIQGWGPIPETAWNKTFDAYGPAVYEQFDKGLALLSKSEHLEKCMAAMAIDPALGTMILDTLTEHRPEDIRTNFRARSRTYGLSV